VLEDKEFLAAMLPTLRADIGVLEAYERSAPRPLSCPITAFGGLRDRTVPIPHLQGWSEQTTASFTRILLEEDHLYLQSARQTLIAHVREALVASACTH
jgi:medium-chain acyl-[acyl-carrier-protein] hydrolase